MGQFDPRFSPLLAAVNGWQSEDLAGAAVLLTTLFAVPKQANSAYVQVPAGQTLQFRTDGDVSGTDFMVLPGPSIWPLVNRRQLESFVVKSPAGTTAVRVAFYEGSVGPMPPVPEIEGTGGVIPPPPPGLSAVYTYNTVHVMDGGDDATGTRNRLDLPFATIAAASAVLQTGDTMVIWPGTHVGQLNVGDVTYHLLGATVTNPAGPVVLCSGVAMSVTGFGTVTRSLSGPCVRVDTEGMLDMQAKIYGGEVALEVYDGTCVFRGQIISSYTGVASDGYSIIRIYGDITSNSGVGADLGDADVVVWGNITGQTGGLISAGPCTVHGNIFTTTGSAASCTAGKQVIYGSVQSADGSGAVVNGGTQVICGDVTSTNGTAALVEGSGANQLIFGNVTATNGVAASTLTASTDSSQTIHGNVYSDVTYAARAGAGPQLIYGNVETGDGTAALCTGYMTIYGNVTGRNSGAAIECNFGLLTVVGNVQGLDSFASGVNASAYGGTVKVVVHGNVTSNTSAQTVKSLAGAVVEVHGNVTNTGTGHGLVVEASGYPDTVGTVTGLVTAAGGVAVYCNGGITTLGRGATTQAAAAAAVQCFRNDSVLILEGNAYLRSTGAAPSITFSGTGATATIRSYGAYASAAVAVGMTVTGTLNILP